MDRKKIDGMRKLGRYICRARQMGREKRWLVKDRWIEKEGQIVKDRWKEKDRWIVKDRFKEKA